MVTFSLYTIFIFYFLCTIYEVYYSYIKSKETLSTEYNEISYDLDE